jgi:ligand-binding SRPBCC domain-containing protein
MYAGLLITYRLRPVWNVPVEWATEIKHINRPRYFADEQRVGPYRFWHHQHFFEEVPGGVRVRDLVHYALGFGPLSGFADALVVRGQLRKIFSYRRETLRDLFGEMPVA